MGFGFLFIGFMLLYDFEIGLVAGGGASYLLLDIFPDVLGFLLLFLGLRKLCQKGEDFAFLKKATLFLFPLSVLMLLKGTLFFSVFYGEAGKASLAATALDACMRLLKLAFTYLLFQKTSAMTFRLGEPKLSSHHGFLPRIALVDGVLYLAATALRNFAPDGFATVTATLVTLELLFWVFLVWFGAICLFRCVLRLSDLSE